MIGCLLNSACLAKASSSDPGFTFNIVEIRAILATLYLNRDYLLHATREYDVGAPRVFRVELVGVAVLPLGQRHAHRGTVVFLM